MTVFVLSCEFEGEFQTLGVFLSLSSALEALSRQYLEEGERIEDFSAFDGQHHAVVYTNIAIYYIDEHILEEVNEYEK